VPIMSSLLRAISRMTCGVPEVAPGPQPSLSAEPADLESVHPCLRAWARMVCISICASG
jgi:hypothetical protein